jgi:hypothetical protein
MSRLRLLTLVLPSRTLYRSLRKPQLPVVPIAVVEATTLIVVVVDLVLVRQTPSALLAEQQAT